MNNIVRAWKDEAYRQSLSTEEQATLPTNPAGEIELTDVELESVFGAYTEADASAQATQSAAATFGDHSIVFGPVTGCAASNSAAVSSTANSVTNSTGSSGFYRHTLVEERTWRVY